MDNRFEQYWRASLYRPRLRYKLALSIAIHFLLIGGIFGYFNWRPKTPPPEVFEVQIMQTSSVVSDTATREVVENPVEESMPEPTPEPEPAPPEPTPEPLPEPTPPPAPEPEVAPVKPPEPKVEPPKPREDKEALAKAEERKREEAKKKEETRLAEEKRKEEEKKKAEAEAKKKAEAEKKKKEEAEKKRLEEEKKKEEAKKREEEKKREEAMEKKAEEDRKKKESLAKNQGEATQGVEEAQLPTALSGWAALVKRKVDRNWVLPAGISLGEEGETIKVGFVVASNGAIMDGPTLLEGSGQAALDNSCVNTIKTSVPLPPFPTGFNEPEQYVVYVFRALP